MNKVPPKLIPIQASDGTSNKLHHLRNRGFEAALGADLSVAADSAKRNRFAWDRKAFIGFLVLIFSLLLGLVVQSFLFQKTQQVQALPIKSATENGETVSAELAGKEQQYNSLNGAGENKRFTETTTSQGEVPGERKNLQLEGALVVYISGAVKEPGVVELPSGARVIDAIEAAGGLTESADQILVNLAQEVSDGQQIYVPAKGEDLQKLPVHLRKLWAEDLSDDATSSTFQDNSNQRENATATGKVDLNQASPEQLQTVPGIGPATAKAIISWREEHGAFQSLNELMNIPGIGARTLAKIQPYLKV
ncbi:MAG: helix-hairpin-helix domain-containing protein [Arcanobacterium sp.]|nr:helix-hairpin-helix domain-containing protein [Arcanobacterium sp.]